MVAESTPNEWQ